jgi:hypothetical protein
MKAMAATKTKAALACVLLAGLVATSSAFCIRLSVRGEQIDEPAQPPVQEARGSGAAEPVTSGPGACAWCGRSAAWRLVPCFFSPKLVANRRDSQAARCHSNQGVVLRQSLPKSLASLVLGVFLVAPTHAVRLLSAVPPFAVLIMGRRQQAVAGPLRRFVAEGRPAYRLDDGDRLAVGAVKTVVFGLVQETQAGLPHERRCGRHNSTSPGKESRGEALSSTSMVRSEQSSARPGVVRPSIEVPTAPPIGRPPSSRLQSVLQSGRLCST